MDIDGIREDGTRVPLFRKMEIGQFKEKLCLEVCLRSDRTISRSYH